MEFISTRGFSDSVEFTQAVAQGLAPDGGLYLPKSFPDLSPNLKDWEGLAYDELCFEFFKLFATDMNPSIVFTEHTQVFQFLKWHRLFLYLINGRSWSFFTGRP